MILQALCDYYKRMADAGDPDLPLYGYATQKIHFALVLSPEGELVGVEDLREATEKKKKVPKLLNVPSYPGQRTGGIVPNFTWDNTGYVLGMDDKDKPERTRGQFEAFKDLHREMARQVDEPALEAIDAFLAAWLPERAPTLQYWDEMIGSNVVFRLDGEREFISQKKSVRELWLERLARISDSKPGRCLVFGVDRPIARLHPPIKGVKDAQTTGASLISFNLDAFESYEKEQNFNAPVSDEASFFYTAALNHLLRFDGGRRVQIGDATTVFWAERDTPVEDFLGFVFSSAGEDTETAADLRLFLEAVRDGKKPPNVGDEGVRFYILGLSPNVKRLFARFWYAGTVGELSGRMGQHFRDLAMVRQFDKDPEFPSIWRILVETVRRGTKEGINPTLSGAMMRAILQGTAYPRTLLSSMINRLRAGDDVTYIKAAAIKAVLVRDRRLRSAGREVPVSLDPNHPSVAYRLGRLFAALEKAQKDALGENINATIRDRYYGSASATPRTVFPQLIRLGQHHISKSERGGHDKRIGEIMDGISEFPAHLSLDDQGLFAIGYYHQRQDFYKKHTDVKEEN